MARKQQTSHGCFSLVEQVSRNHASLPACHVFTQFLVWTQEGLAEDQAFGRSMQEQIRQAEQDKLDARIKYMETTNPITKAKYVRAMYKAMENVHNFPKCDHIPMDDSQLVQLDNGLVLAKRGTVWTTSRKAGSFSFWGSRPTKAGYATINLVDNQEEGVVNTNNPSLAP